MRAEDMKWDPRTKELTVVVGGEERKYGNVRQPAWDAFRQAGNLTAYFEKYIAPVYLRVESGE